MAKRGDPIMDFNPGDDIRTRRRFELGRGTVLETNVEGFDPTVLRGMTEADLRAILDRPPNQP